MDANFWQAEVERVVPNALAWATGDQRHLHPYTRTLFNRKERKERREIPAETTGISFD
jgi:hypothetical protein